MLNIFEQANGANEVHSPYRNAMASAVTNRDKNDTRSAEQIRAQEFEDQMNGKGKDPKEFALKLIAETIKNQTPDDPMKPAEMMQMTSMIALVNESVESRKVMSEQLKASKAALDIQAFNMIGAIIPHEGQFMLEDDGHATMRYEMPASTASAELTIKNGHGDVVRTLSLEDLEAQSFDNTFAWDGKNEKGENLPHTDYYKAELVAKDPEGKYLESSLKIHSQVTKVQFDKEGIPRPYIDNLQITHFDQILAKKA